MLGVIMLFRIIGKMIDARIDELRAEFDEKVDVKVSEKLGPLEARLNSKFTELDKKILSVKDLRDITSKNLVTLKTKLTKIASDIKDALGQ